MSASTERIFNNQIMKQVIAHMASDGALFRTKDGCQEYELSLQKEKQHGSLLRSPSVIKRLGIGRSNWWKGVKDGKYPPGIKLSTRVTVWNSKDIDALIESLTK